MVHSARCHPVPTVALYSAIIGSNPLCQECGAAGRNCSPGNYCGDGLCQTCNVAAHCCPMCRTCPATTPICSAGQCVECVSSDMCPPGQRCWSGRCGPGSFRRSDADCKPGYTCTLDGCLFDFRPPQPCFADRDCAAVELCDPDFLVCRPRPTPCATGRDCSAYEYCDGAASLCKPRNR